MNDRMSRALSGAVAWLAVELAVTLPPAGLRAEPREVPSDTANRDALPDAKAIMRQLRSLPVRPAFQTNIEYE
jgi:hypothetical protein